MTNPPTPHADHEAPQSDENSADSAPAPGDQEVDPSSEASSQSPDVVSELLRLGRFLKKNKTD